MPKRRLVNPSSIQKTRHAKKKACESIINPKTKKTKTNMPKRRRKNPSSNKKFNPSSLLE
jgi:hypothetical protein